MPTIREELVALSRRTRKAGESDDTFLRDVALKVNGLGDDQWTRLSDVAQQWTNEALEIVDHNNKVDQGGPNAPTERKALPPLPDESTDEDASGVGPEDDVVDRAESDESDQPADAEEEHVQQTVDEATQTNGARGPARRGRKGARRRRAAPRRARKVAAAPAPAPAPAAKRARRGGRRRRVQIEATAPTVHDPVVRTRGGAPRRGGRRKMARRRLPVNGPQVTTETFAAEQGVVTITTIIRTGRAAETAITKA